MHIGLELGMLPLVLTGFSGRASGQEELRLTKYCAFDVPSERQYAIIDSAMVHPSVDVAIELIVTATGLQPNFDVIAGDVDDAMAVISDSRRVIVYGSHPIVGDWSDAVDRRSPHLLGMMLAHLVGHHLQGHSLRDDAGRVWEERNADRFAGLVMQRLGASLDRATKAMDYYTLGGPSATHRGEGSRVASIAVGWLEGEELKATGFGREPPSTVQVPQGEIEFGYLSGGDPAPVAESASHFVMRAVLFDDPRSYYVRSDDIIIAIGADGRGFWAGRRTPALEPGLAWTYWTPSGAYGVRRDGTIVEVKRDGQSDREMGYMTVPVAGQELKERMPE